MISDFPNETNNTSLRFLDSLNDVQKQSATHKEGPAVVYAGAGSGKTRVICSRIAWLIENDVFPSQILAVTFTNKAAKEMRERIEQMVGPFQAKNLLISTFHSFCSRYLRVFASHLGFTNDFSIYDDDDQKAMLKNIMKEHQIDDKFISLANIKSQIDKFKNAGISVEAYMQKVSTMDPMVTRQSSFQFRNFGEKYQAEIIAKVYQLYQRELLKANAMDFNDLLVQMNKVLDIPEVLAKLQNRFHYFLIDEFQDTNPIQFKLISKLSSHTKNLFIVGDDDQSIYSWRGADPSYIINFGQLHDEAKVYKLEENYRSTQNIITAALNVIKNNKGRAPKSIFTQNPPGEMILASCCYDAKEEAAFVAKQILKNISNGGKLSDMCLLYRTNAQSRALEDELRRHMLPYVIYGSVRFYERAEVKILLSYLRILINPQDESALLKVINLPRRGLGDKAIIALRTIANRDNISILQAAHAVVTDKVSSSDISKQAKSGLTKFISQYLNWKSLLEGTIKPSRLLEVIKSDIEFETYLRKSYEEDFKDRALNVLELRNALAEFEETYADFPENIGIENVTTTNVLSSFLEQALLTIEPSKNNVQEGTSDAVTLMTVHSSKGLEFPNVILTGLEEGVFPHFNSIGDVDAEEEERRLMYVAITRAKLTLTVTHILKGRFYGANQGNDFATASRFLKEIPSELLHWASRVPSYGIR